MQVSAIPEFLNQWNQNGAPARTHHFSVSFSHLDGEPFAAFAADAHWCDVEWQLVVHAVPAAVHKAVVQLQILTWSTAQELLRDCDSHVELLVSRSRTYQS